jgi:hypothetical protein
MAILCKDFAPSNRLRLLVPVKKKLAFGVLLKSYFTAGVRKSNAAQLCAASFKVRDLEFL